jgi:predicted nucleotidyltransferase
VTTLLTASADNSVPDRPPTLRELLELLRARIQVTPEELAEARRRRDLLAAALLDEFPGSRTYVNGSVAHGDALDPLTDIDLGVVVAEAKDTHGPGKKGCADLQERAAKAIRDALKEEEFPDLRVEWKARKRSILVRFAKSVSSGEGDFTADVIVAIEHPDKGLYIPNHATWSRSHPEEHTRMIREANKTSQMTFARVVRLLKHYNRRNQHPLCSWNIKALALGAITASTRLVVGMKDWFDHAIEELSEGLTEDPAGVAEKPIALNELTRAQVVDQLERDRDRLVRAIELEDAGYQLQAHEQLAKFFNDKDLLPFPDPDAVLAEVARKLATDRAAAKTAAAAAVVPIATVPVVGHHPDQHAPRTRSWGVG